MARVAAGPAHYFEPALLGPALLRGAMATNLAGVVDGLGAARRRRRRDIDDTEAGGRGRWGPVDGREGIIDDIEIDLQGISSPSTFRCTPTVDADGGCRRWMPTVDADGLDRIRSTQSLPHSPSTCAEI